MIFYFTGTGNSSYVAKNIAEHNNERVLSITEQMKLEKDKFEYILDDGEIIGFVYPVYAWAPPKLVLDFVSKVSFKNYKNNYIFSIATCGANIGNTMKVLSKALENRELCLNSGFSLIMPNNYIIMGDVDSKEIEKSKLEKAEERLKSINRIIQERKNNVFELEKGFLPGILTAMINPMFNKHAMDTRKFYATDDCIGCGLCEKACSMSNILVNKKPTWGTKCNQCLSCIHRCPTRAIQYGNSTIKKGRYINPNV